MGISSSTLMYAALASAAAGTAMTAYNATQGMPAPPGPTPPPQPGQLPNTQNVTGQMAGRGQAGGQAGVASTFLTGPGGVDPGALSLGKATLLGQ